MNYQSFLQTAQQGYRDTLSGYATALSGMQAQQASINEGYNQLQRNVLGRLEGSSAAESQAIADRYAAMSGAMRILRTPASVFAFRTSITPSSRRASAHVSANISPRRMPV